MVLGSLWKRFLSMLPSAPRYVAEVVSLGATLGDYTVQLDGGGFLQVTGAETFAEGDRVFVVDGRIEGAAPNLTSVVIDV